MPKIARAGIDVAGGTLITPPTQKFCFANGFPIAVLNQKVKSHGLSPHSNAIITSSSKATYVDSIGVVRIGDSASCGHSVSTGSPNTFSE